MNPKISLLPNTQVSLIKRNNQIRIYKKEENTTKSKIICRMSSDLTNLEEMPSGSKEFSILVEIYPFRLKNMKKQQYILNLYHIDLKDRIYEKIKFYSTEEPQKITKDLYIINDEDYGITILNKNGIFSSIEKKIRECLNLKETDKIELHNFDSKKDTNFCELTIKFGTLETLHFILKLDQELKVYNIFYSEMASGAEFILDSTKEKNCYITEFNFLKRIKKQPIIKEIEYFSVNHHQMKKNRKIKRRP